MRRLLTLTALLMLIVPATAARADGGYQQLLIEACKYGHITHHYSQATYRKALASLPTDANEYTDCYDVLRRGQLAAAGGHSGGGAGGGAAGGTGGGSVPPGASPLASATPAEKRALTRATAHGASPVSIAGEVVKPGRVNLAGLTGSHGLPTSLLVAFVLLALGGVGTAVATVITRVRARRSS
jgi:hypothetical protein